MRPTKAKIILLSYIREKNRLPIYDEIIYQITEKQQLKQYSFRELLKIAYNLKDA